MARAVGAVVSLSALALILSAVPGGTTTPRAYHLVWLIMAGLALAALAAAWAVIPRANHLIK
jgi:hypothetical protein